jgi:hypothetical protein
MQMDRMRNVRGKTQRPEDFDEDDAEESVDPAVQAALSAALWADLHPLNQADLADDGSDADADHGGADTAANGTTSSSPMLPVAKICALCGHDAKYTCPRCAARTCSLTCIRRHKAEKPCSGIADVTEMVPLSKFSDKHLQRDFHFIEDVKRAVDNAHRGFDNTWRFSFRALPPPLHALREAAKKRGVLCQITSEGMSKRDRNTSRYDRRRDSIIWHIDFDVKGTVSTKNFAVECHWGNERFLLKDIFAQSWESNPRLPSYHIRRGYNRASSWVENPAGPVAGHDHKNGENGNDNARGRGRVRDAERPRCAEQRQRQHTGSRRHVGQRTRQRRCRERREAAGASAAARVILRRSMVKRWSRKQMLTVHTRTWTAGNKVHLLDQADRVGSVDCYFKLNPRRRCMTTFDRSSLSTSSLPSSSHLWSARRCIRSSLTNSERPCASRSAPGLASRCRNTRRVLRSLPHRRVAEQQGSGSLAAHWATGSSNMRCSRDPAISVVLRVLTVSRVPISPS